MIVFVVTYIPGPIVYEYQNISGVELNFEVRNNQEKILHHSQIVEFGNTAKLVKNRFKNTKVKSLQKGF